jgi:uncharacterized alkaline shock family protein YloU
MPDDWGLNPPIDTLPQIAQERAMLVLGAGMKREVTGAPDLGEGRTGRYDSTALAGTARRLPPRISEVAPRVPTASTPGRSIVSRRAVVDIVRTATLGSYGVTGFAGGIVGRVLGRLGFIQPGIRVSFGDRAIKAALSDDHHSLLVDLDLTVAYGVPIAEVARQVDSAVRYALRRALGREVAHLTIHVDGLRYQPGDLPATPIAAAGVRPDDLAASGTDVA